MDRQGQQTHRSTLTGDRPADRQEQLHEQPRTRPSGSGEPLTVTDSDGDMLHVMPVRMLTADPRVSLHTAGPTRTVYLDRDQALEVYHKLGDWLMATAPAEVPEDDGDAASYAWPDLTNDTMDSGLDEPLAEWERDLLQGPAYDDRDTLDPTRTILDDANAAVYGDRQTDYGHPREDFTRTAIIWTGLLHHKLADGVHLEPEDIARCMIGVKLARDVHAPKRDNRVDGAGYFLTLDRLETGR